MMTDDLLVKYLRGLGLSLEAAQDSGLAPYIVVRNVEVPQGTLAGRICDVALARCESMPYVCPPAIHTRPALVAMDMAGPLRTQASALGTEWQYWSRRFDRVPSPQLIWTHILSVLTEV